VLADIGGILAANATFESQANLVSWIDVISGLIGGIMLLAFPAITRWFARVERRLLLHARNRPSAARTTSSCRPPVTPQWYDQADSRRGTMPWRTTLFAGGSLGCRGFSRRLFVAGRGIQ
jgi:hypothetical protein